MKADMYYVFDIDGTLTPSRGVIDTEFALWFKAFMQAHPVCFVTGSDRDKTVEQIGEELFNLAEYSFNCAGSEVYQHGQSVYTSDWTLPEQAWLWLENELYNSQYTSRYGKHFEQRTGLLNFSVVGRNAGSSQRVAYYEWDKVNNERVKISQRFNKRFPELQAQVGGETGIDIFPKGRDKSQILDWFAVDSQFKFYGDRIDPDGNDFALAKAIVDQGRGQCYNVKDWQETWELLRDA